MLVMEDARIAREIFYQNHTDCSQIWKLIIFSLLEARFWILFCSFHHPDSGSIQTPYCVFDDETLVLPFDRVVGILFLFKCFWSESWYCLTPRLKIEWETLCSVSELKEKIAKKTHTLRFNEINLISEIRETLKTFREGSEGSTRSFMVHYSCYLVIFVFCIHNIDCSNLRTYGLYEAAFLHMETILVPQCTPLDSDLFQISS